MSDAEPLVSADIITADTITLTDEDIRDAARLFRIISSETPWANVPICGHPTLGRPRAPSTRVELLFRARTVLQLRQLRIRHFNRAMFSEPAWDILLLLYLADLSDGRQTIGQLALSVDAPQTTASRWVDYLENEHLVERNSHLTDQRIVFIGLTGKGRSAMDTFLNEIS